MQIENAADIVGPMFGAVAKDSALALEQLHLRKDAAILDVGTGKGQFAIYLASQGFHVLTGEPDTDVSRYARQGWAQKAEKMGVLDRISFQPFEASELPFALDMFDAVFFFGVLHHIDESVRQTVFREALRVAKQNGAVVFFEPRQQTLEKIWADDPNHPVAAIPSNYAAGQKLHEQRIEGSMMDIFIYRNSHQRNA